MASTKRDKAMKNAMLYILEQYVEMEKQSTNDYKYYCKRVDDIDSDFYRLSYNYQIVLKSKLHPSISSTIMNILNAIFDDNFEDFYEGYMEHVYCEYEEEFSEKKLNKYDAAEWFRLITLDDNSYITSNTEIIFSVRVFDKKPKVLHTGRCYKKMFNKLKEKQVVCTISDVKSLLIDDDLDDESNTDEE